ncbi:MAG TPA: ATP-binding cassette domain-containing protein [Acidimicrobiales bacterium]|nr:ATP-binding cassette domain-containing protein [Acidimicrobiales bacterium]
MPVADDILGPASPSAVPRPSDGGGPAGGGPAGGGQAGGNVPPAVVAVRGITKHFGTVQALRGVDLDIYKGEIVGLVGDNGAGKSTLVNIISGGLQPNTGHVLVDGKRVSFSSALEARRLGIETVYQDLALAPDLSVWANIFLGREKTVSGPLGWLGWLDRRSMASSAGEDLARTRIRIGSVDAVAGRLSGGQRQAIAVGRAVAWGSKIILMDEPTAALGVEQQERVAELITSVAAQGVPVLLISHNLPQVYRLCHRVAVLFQGQLVANLRPSECTLDDIVSWITGAALGATRP